MFLYHLSPSVLRFQLLGSTGVGTNATFFQVWLDLYSDHLLEVRSFEGHSSVVKVHLVLDDVLLELLAGGLRQAEGVSAPGMHLGCLAGGGIDALIM